LNSSLAATCACLAANLASFADYLTFLPGASFSFFTSTWAGAPLFSASSFFRARSLSTAALITALSALSPLSLRTYKPYASTASAKASLEAAVGAGASASFFFRASSSSTAALITALSALSALSLRTTRPYASTASAKEPLDAAVLDGAAALAGAAALTGAAALFADGAPQDFLTLSSNIEMS